MPIVSDAETRQVHRARVADGGEACNAALPNYSDPDRAAEYCDERVCLCVFVCLSAIISSELHIRFSPNFLCMLSMAVARSFSGGI